MANSEAGTSSDVEQAIGDEYQVFLSFRGPDTRYGFTDFLYHGLVDAGVRVFRDEDELRVGEVIGGNLLRAINNSAIYIPIFSRTYASSKWCLRELAHIVDNVSRSKGRKSILPIFFDVEPDDVKLKTSRYGDALLEHASKFPDEVRAWRKALAEVDEIKGWNVKRDQSQAAIVKLVVTKVLENLEVKQKLVTEHLVGLDDRVKHLTELLDVDHPDVRLIGIYGMGGIGKTTIAKVVFNELSSHFGKCCSFLENVRESMSTKDGIVQLQKKLLSDIVGSEYAERVKDSEQGMRWIGETLGTNKVLVVLDDADNKEHIKGLIGNGSLHSGSKIIITTRNTTILHVQGFKGKMIPYEMLKMDDALALRLFCRHAFGKDFPLDDYQGLSREIVSSTGGLPLAIEVIGSVLYHKNKSFWKETLVRLRNVPEEEILKKLKISYDDLDEFQQQIFLDIACFFVNESKTDAIYMWTDCKFYPERGIEVLTNKCLIKLLDNDKLWMHDQLIDMGRQIVHQESPSDLGKRSRLWNAKEALEIIRTEERKDKIQALEISGSDRSIEITNEAFGWSPNLRYLEKSGLHESIVITNEEFERLPNLRFIKLRNGTYAGDFAKCRSKLRWISWQPTLQDFRADNIYFDHLVVFKLHRNHFMDDSKAWDLIKRAWNLKVISLTDCHGITTIPNFSKCLGLERLTLVRCRNLKRIESFIGDLQSLIKLEINGCTGLTNLPEEMGALVKLESLSLSGCSELRELPGSLGNMTSLIELNLSKTWIRELPSSIEKLKSLRILYFSLNSIALGEYCNINEDFLQFPSGISTLVNLEELDFSGHRGMRGEIPIGIGELSSLRILNLECTSIWGIPKTINRLHHLQTLNLGECHKIEELPQLPTSLTYLRLESASLLSVPNLLNLTNLVDLLLSNGGASRKKSNLIQGCNLKWIGRLSRLKRLELSLLDVPAPPELASLSHLEKLVLRSLDLRPLMQLPSSDWGLRNLSTLELYWCGTEEIALAGLPRLVEFAVWSSSPLPRLSIPSELRKLRRVSVFGCGQLVEIQVAGPLKSLEYLSVSHCDFLIGISGLSYLKNLETLEFRHCCELANIEGLNELESLKSLKVGWCESLTWSIDASCTKVPDNCLLEIAPRDIVRGLENRLPFKRYREEILPNTSNKLDGPFTIRFHLGLKRAPCCGLCKVGREIERKKENVTADSVTYKGLIADVKGFGFHFKRMWYKYKNSYMYWDQFLEIKSDEQVQAIAQMASKRGSIHLNVEGGVDSEYEGEHDDDMMELLREESAIKTDVYSDKDGAEWDVPSPDKDLDSASVGESKADGNSTIDDFRSKPGNAECFEATGRRRQMRDGRKAASTENRKKEKDESGEPADQNDAVRSSSPRCRGVEHQESSCKATTEVEDEGDLSFVKRDRSVETDRIPTRTGRGRGTGRASHPGRDPAERGGGRDVASSSGNSKHSRPGRDSASTSGKSQASNSGRSISSISRSSATLSSGRGRGSISGKGTTLSSGRDAILSLGKGRGSSSRRSTTDMGTSSSSGRGIASSSRSSSTLSTGRGRGSTSGKGATLSLGKCATKMGASSRSGTDKDSRSAKSVPQTSSS